VGGFRRRQKQAAAAKARRRTRKWNETACAQQPSTDHELKRRRNPPISANFGGSQRPIIECSLFFVEGCCYCWLSAQKCTRLLGSSRNKLTNTQKEEAEEEGLEGIVEVCHCPYFYGLRVKKSLIFRVYTFKFPYFRSKIASKNEWNKWKFSIISLGFFGKKHLISSISDENSLF
jgi:hypothetical protein